MAIISIRIDDDIKRRLGRIADMTGLSQSEFLPEAVYEKLEELEDFQLAKERMEKPFRTVPNEQVWKDLGTES